MSVATIGPTRNPMEPKVNYADLTKTYTLFCKRRADHWRTILQDSAQQMVDEFEASLDLAASTWQDRNLKTHRYVQLGEVEGGAFVPRQPLQLIGHDDVLRFAIQLTLEKGPNLHPKLDVNVPVEFLIDDNRIRVTIANQSTVPLYVQKLSAPGRFSEAVTAVKAAVERHFSRTFD